MSKQQKRRKKIDTYEWGLDTRICKIFIDKWNLRIAESMTLRGRGLIQYYLRMDPPNYNRAEQILNDDIFREPLKDR